MSKKESSSSSSSTATVFHGYATPLESKHKKGLFSGISNLLDDTKEKGRKTRIVGKPTSRELAQFEKLKRVYEGVYGNGTCPVHFKLEEKTVGEDSVVGVFTKSFDLFHYSKGFQPDTEYFHTTNWYRAIDNANGLFRPEAKAIVNIICTFQSNKHNKRGVADDGYPDDPENLFLEEFKTWICEHFANFAEKDKDNIRKRVGYLEDILCKSELFDNPTSTDTHTVQKVVVHVRRILKTTIDTIDAMKQHQDAGATLEEIMTSLRIFMDESVSLLWFSFRDKSMLEGQVLLGKADLAARLHLEILQSPNLRTVLPHRAVIVRDPLAEMSRPTGQLAKKLPAPLPIVELNDKGLIQVKADLVEGGSSSAPVVALTEEQLTTLFLKDNSGFDRNFRGNAVISSLFLESYALLLELGSLFGVLKQAKGAAQTGGTMLLYGAANAHFNALLELTERLADGMRSRLNKIVAIGEARFEQLVEMNFATVTRCSWIANYRELPRTLVQVEKSAAEIFRNVSKARSEANALTLKERTEQAEEETQSFLNAADGLTKRAGKSLQISYNSYAVQQKEEENSVSKITNSVKESFSKLDGAEKKKYEDELQKAVEEEQKEMQKQLTAVDPNKKGLSQYSIVVRTSDAKFAGTDANIFCVLIGTKGSTDKIELPDEDNKKFEEGGEDSYSIDVEGDIGELKQLTLGHDNSGGMGSGWHVWFAEVTDKNRNSTQLFVYDVEIGGRKKPELTVAAAAPDTKRPDIAAAELKAAKKDKKTKV